MTSVPPKRALDTGRGESDLAAGTPRPVIRPLYEAGLDILSVVNRQDGVLSARPISTDRNADDFVAMDNSSNIDILVAGAFAALTIDLFVYPLDTIKTRIQSRDYLETYASSAKGGRAKALTARGLYQGIGSVVVATLPAAGLFFSVYESSKRIVGGALPSGTPLPVVHSISSGLAELSSCVILTPAEVIKQEAQMIQKESGGQARASSSLRAFAMLKNAPEGRTRRLWSGYSALAARNLPFTGLQFPLFEATRARLWKALDDGETRKRAGGVEAGQRVLQTGAVNGISAAVAGSTASCVTTPTDVVKTRMMLMGDEGGRRRGGFQVTVQIYRESGVPGLFRGWLLKAVWTALGSGLYLGTYEAAKVWLREDRMPERHV